MRVRIEFEQVIPDVDATIAQINEWVMWITHYDNKIDSSNPLVHIAIEAYPNSLKWSRRDG